ncbi:MAG: hypothetical protein ACRC2T_17495 [Thermoguttaceae bacterium]
MRGFDYPIIVDLSGVAIKSQRIPIRRDHKEWAGVGHSTNIAIAGGVISASGIISRDTEFSRDIVHSGKLGFPWQASIGGPVHKTRFLAPGQKEIVNGKSVEGPLHIDTAVSTFTETAHFYPWFLTTQYIAFLGRAYGCVNNMPFRGFSDGEVRFLGASGSYRSGDTSVEMTFKFAVSPNAQNIRIGEMTIPFKYGWDYLWVRWAEMKKGNITVKVPVEAYIEQVYQGLNFGTLGIGF